MRNAKLWKQVVRGGLVPFLEKLHGPNPMAMDYFEKN